MLYDPMKIKSWIPLINLAVATWPNESWPYWHHYNDSVSKKYATKDSLRLIAPCKLLIDRMVSHVSECGDLPPGVFPDLDMHGSGMHMMKKGGSLKPHVDSEVHPATGWYRKYSTILFLTECSGGTLCFDEGGLTKRVEPGPGNIITIDSRKRHWVEPVEDGDRLSISLFWWSLAGSGSSTKAEFFK